MKQFFYVLIVLLATQCNICMEIKPQLTLDQKIGQLFIVAAVADEELAKECIARKKYRIDKEYVTQLINDYHIGGIIFFGKSDIEKQKARTEYFQNASKIPLLVGQDLEPGKKVGGYYLPFMNDFPDNQQLGKDDNKDQTYHVASDIGKVCKDIGVHINFAPVADVNNNPDNPIINDRSFGDNPDLVAQHSIVFAQGLKDAGIIACAKHFPGHGDTDVDSHKALPKIVHDKERLHAIELYPFKKLIAENIPMIMMAHLEIPAFEPEENLPSSLSKNIVTKLLRKELGFKGIIITDALEMKGITPYCSYKKAPLHALLAGNDILLCPVDVPGAVKAIKKAITKGRITEQEIDEHVQRILDLKKMLGLLK